MRKILLSKVAFLLLFAIAATFSVSGQVTTSAISGIVSDDKGTGLPGATVIAIHELTGTKYGTTTRADGRFNFNNVNSGLYNLTTSYVGFKPNKVSLSTTLGDAAKISIVLSDESSQLQEVVVTADKNFNKSKIGSEINISSNQILASPTVTRSLSDFTRLTPQVKVDVNGAVSVAGQNNRYNSIYIDGAANNDVFGLSVSGTNGGQTGISPISVDAIEQFKVVISPYDVSLSGFTGGGINAVTRSGTNNISGSAYYFIRNQNLSGKRPGTDAQFEDPKFVRSKLADFKTSILGFRLGGAIIKNKLFYFINGEIEKQKSPVPFSLSNYQGSFKAAELDNLKSVLLSKYNYDAGSYTDIVNELNSDKITGKLDWNISDKHKLSLSHRYTYGVSNRPAASSNTQINFSNGGILFPSTTNSSSLELKSNFSNNLMNKILIGYTKVFDDRDPIGSDFPNVLINQTSTKDRIAFGTEAFSTANQLDSKILTFNQKLDYYAGKHSLSFGVDGEFGDFYNLFVRQNYGAYTYTSLADFLGDKNPSNYARSYSLFANDISGDGSKAAAEFKSARYGIFLSDQIEITNKFSITAGIRYDLNTFPTVGIEDKSFNTNFVNTINAIYPLEGAKAGLMPDIKANISPRIGFNYDVKGDKTLQIRGGTGIFLGRVPMVWPGGVYNNNGVTIGGVARNGIANTKPFIGDPFKQYNISDFGGANSIPQGELNLITNTFKLPSVLRSSIGVDKKLGDGWLLTLEGIYTKNYNDVAYENVILDKGGIKAAAGADTRAIYNPTGTAPAKIDLDASVAGIQNPYTNIFLMKNAAKSDNGYSYNLSAKIEKIFSNNLTTSLSYTYGKSMVLNEATSSQNSSQWRFMETVGGRNNMKLSTSDFDLGSRIVGFVSYKIDYLKFGGTTFTMFYNGQSGNPFSYVYRNSIVNDWARTESNDLVFIPASKDQVAFKDAATADAQWTALDAYISADKYLSKNRGSYAERNSNRSPFTNIFDIKIMQDFSINVAGKKNTLQLTWDIFNFGNMLNKKWGRQYFVTNDNYALMTFDGFKDAAKGDYTPLMTFTKPAGAQWNISDGSFNSSRWSSQVGVRYIFN